MEANESDRLRKDGNKAKLKSTGSYCTINKRQSKLVQTKTDSIYSALVTTKILKARFRRKTHEGNWPLTNLRLLPPPKIKHLAYQKMIEFGNS